MAYITTNKFVDALPFYRQEKIFERLKIEFGRGIMAHNVIHVAGRCNPLVELMEKEIRSGPLIQIDETTVQVMKEPGRANTTKSYMWVFRGGTRDHPVLIYQYHPTRSGDAAREFVKNYRGYVQTDDFSGYDFLDKMEGVNHVGCLAHVRRKFADVIKAKGKGVYRSQLAEEALDYIKEIYEIERFAKSLNYTPDQIREIRQEKAKAVLDDFKKWLDDHKDQAPPGSLLGKAFHYAGHQWVRVIKYLDNGILYPDNNLAENAIRPFVVGRKNWLFSGHPRGAKASATLYSLVETAKANGLEPYQYLNFLFERLPYAQTEEDYRKLLPMYVKLDPIKKSEISTD
jgi:transposase